jgi:hypothetical protein
MARFDPPINPTRDPNYLGLSKETDKPRPDTSMEKLFSGMGDALSGIVTTIDDSNRAAFKNQVSDAVERERGEQGVTVARASPDPLNLDRSKTLTAPRDAGDPLNLSNPNPDRVDMSNLPPGVQKVGDNIDRLKNAYTDGRLSDTYYSTRLDAEVRRIKAQFPGYRDEIDTFVKSKLGFDPANKLRESIRAELDTAKSRLEQDEKDKNRFIQANFKYDPEGAKAVLNGRKSFSDFQISVGEKQAEEHAIDVARKKIAFSNDLSSQNTDNAMGVLHQELSSAVSGSLEQAMTRIGGGTEGFLRIIQEAQKAGRPLKPEEQQAVRAGMAQLKAEVALRFDSIINTELAPGSGKTYASIIKDKTKIDGVRDIQLARIDALEKQLTDGQFGLLNLNTNLIAAVKSDTVKKLFDQDDVWKTFSALRELGGDGLINGVYSRMDSKLLDRVTKAVVGLTLNKTVTTGESVEKKIDQLEGAKKTDGNTLRGIFESHTEAVKEALKSKDTNPKVLENLVKGMYEGNVLSKFNAKDRLTIFGMMAAPEISQGLQKNNPELFQRYSTWVQRSLPGLLAVQGAKVQEGIDMGTAFNVTFDKGMFKVEETPKGPGQARQAPLLKSVQDAVTDINRGLALAKPVVEASGVDFNQYVQQVIRGIGISGQGPRNEKGFWQKLYDSVIGGGENQNVQEPTEKGSGKLSLQTSTPMSDFIGKAEGADYDTLYSGWKGPKVKVTDLTVAEALEYQAMNRAAGAESSPIGKGQFMPDTIRSLVKEGVVSLRDQLTAETQEKMIEALIERRRKQATRNGVLDREAFADALAEEWAALPTAEGKSRYEGIAGNKATVSRKKLLAMLEGR